MKASDLYNTFLLRDILRYGIPGTLVLSSIRILSLSSPNLHVYEFEQFFIPFSIKNLYLFSIPWVCVISFASWFIGHIVDRAILVIRDPIQKVWDKSARKRLPETLLLLYRVYSDWLPNNETEEEDEYKDLRQWAAAIVHQYAPKISDELFQRDTLEKFYFNTGTVLFILVVALHTIVRPWYIALILLIFLTIYSLLQIYWSHKNNRPRILQYLLISLHLGIIILVLIFGSPKYIVTYPISNISPSTFLIIWGLSAQVISFLITISFWQRYHRDIDLFPVALELLINRNNKDFANSQD